MTKNKKEEMKMIYEYNEPKTQEEKEKQERSLSKAYELLFEATLERVDWPKDSFWAAMRKWPK